MFEILKGDSVSMCTPKEEGGWTERAWAAIITLSGTKRYTVSSLEKSTVLTKERCPVASDLQKSIVLCAQNPMWVFHTFTAIGDGRMRRAAGDFCEYVMLDMRVPQSPQSNFLWNWCARFLFKSLFYFGLWCQLIWIRISKGTQKLVINGVLRETSFCLESDTPTCSADMHCPSSTFYPLQLWINSSSCSQLQHRSQK